MVLDCRLAQLLFQAWPTRNLILRNKEGYMQLTMVSENDDLQRAYLEAAVARTDIALSTKCTELLSMVSLRLGLTGRKIGPKALSAAVAALSGLLLRSLIQLSIIQKP